MTTLSALSDLCATDRDCLARCQIGGNRWEVDAPFLPANDCIHVLAPISLWGKFYRESAIFILWEYTKCTVLNQEIRHRNDFFWTNYYCLHDRSQVTGI